MNTLITLALIQLSVVIITDISGVWDNIEQAVSKWLHCKIKLPHICICSFCQTWWIGLIWLIASGRVNMLMIAALLMLCTFTSVTSSLVRLITDSIGSLINFLYKKL